MVARPGPPRVDMKTTSKLANAAITVIVTHTPISDFNPGRVTVRNCFHRPAPSRAAASYRVASILPIPDSSSRVHSPVRIQVPMNPTAGKAQVKSPSQARVQDSRPIADSSWLTAPLGVYIQVQAIAAAAPGMMYGRNMIVRAVAVSTFDRISRTTEATSSQIRMGQKVEKMIG